MKRVFILIALFLSMGIMGCDDKEDSNPCANYSEQEKAKSYDWSVGNFGKDEEYRITKQAKHFKISKLDEAANYKYEPQSDFTGTDVVEIFTKTNEADGINVCETTYRLTFTVLECGMKTQRKLISKNIYDPCPDYTKEERAKKYKWDLGNFGKGEEYRITKQTKHFKISKLDEKAHFQYEPQADFTGTDVVEIFTKTNEADGINVCETIYRLTFRVLECGMKTERKLISKNVYDPCPDYTEQEKAKSYEWDLGNFGKGEECRIIKQAEHFKISKLDEKAHFQYEPQADFTGTDVVEIFTKTNEADGINVCETIYRLTFTVLECGMKTERKLISKNVYDPCPDYTKEERAKKYKLVIGSLGDEGESKIIKQAQHFKVSKIVRDKGTYYYQPQDGFVGADSVQIKVRGNSAEGSSQEYITVYEIKFDITECGMKVFENKKVIGRIVDTWKCVGFGNTETNKVKPIEPKNCDECYVLTFKEDGTFTGKVVANSISGSYNQHSNSFQFVDVLTTLINEPYDGNSYIDIISKKIMNYSFSDKNELLLYYNDKKEYLLFNLKK